VRQNLVQRDCRRLGAQNQTAVKAVRVKRRVRACCGGMRLLRALIDVEVTSSAREPSRGGGALPDA